MANFRVDVEPDVLQWARESIGLSEEDAAKKLGVTPLELRFLEEGADSPTLSRLQKMVKVYKRPLAVFFLPKPPKDFDAMKDFRLLPGIEGRPCSPNLMMAFRRVHRQREVALELSELEDETPPLLDLSVSLNTNPESAGQEVRAWLGTPDSTEDLNQWIGLVEDKAILVTQVAGINLDEMRGYSISDEPFPVIVLNGKDSSRGRVFSLIHELVHILLHAGGFVLW
jgi:transcriptional regulator with XRE-family HTH domain